MKIKQLLMIGLLALPAFVQAQKLYTYPIGVQAYTFRNQFPKDVAKTLDLIQSMGLRKTKGGLKKAKPQNNSSKCAQTAASVFPPQA